MATPLFYDRIKETSTTTGTGTLTLAGAVANFRAFSTVGNGNTTCYLIEHQSAAEWEVGIGTYTAAGTTLSRDVVLSSSNSNNAVDFAAGTKHVAVVDAAAFAGPQVVRPGGRLTLTTAVPVTSADVTAAGTVYYSPHADDRIELWNGAAWEVKRFSEKSLAVTTFRATRMTPTGDTTNASPVISGMSSTAGIAVGDPITGSGIPAGSVVLEVSSGTSVIISANATATATGVTLTIYNANYDLFGYLSSGDLALEALAWTSNSARATALTRTEGRYTKSGDKTRLYLGSVRLTRSDGTEDSNARRFCWNNCNRVPRKLLYNGNTGTWVYNTAAFRYANNSLSSRVEVFVGLAEDAVDLICCGYNENGGAGSNVGIGVDAATVNSADIFTADTTLATVFAATTARLKTVPAAGWHFFSWIENGQGSAGCTWFGSSGSNIKCGITGTLLA